MKPSKIDMQYIFSVTNRCRIVVNLPWQYDQLNDWVCYQLVTTDDGNDIVVDRHSGGIIAVEAVLESYGIAGLMAWWKGIQESSRCVRKAAMGPATE